MEQRSEEWDGISDSEFLNVELEEYSPEEPPQLPSQSNTNQFIINKSSISIPVSPHSTEESPEQSPVKAEERGEKRKRRSRNGRSALLRFSKHHISVTQLCEQAWCEMKLVYGFLHPHIRRTDKQRPEVQSGKDFHLARELEVNEVVPVHIQTREDCMAIKLLNMLQMIPVLKAGQCVREFPVFGVLEGVYLMGVIDELSYNQKGELVLNELKTRRENTLPGDAQTLTHYLQVSVYKLLFDALVRGEVKREHIVECLDLQLALPLGSGVLAHTDSIGIQVDTLGEVVGAFLLTLSCSDLPCIDILQLEYRHQGSSTLIGTTVASFDEAQVRAEIQDYVAYWTGQREPRGVDIEDLWKCGFCPYKEMCEWRKNRLQVPETLHTTERTKSTDVK